MSELVERLRAALAEYERTSKKERPLPWALWTSCSQMRIGSAGYGRGGDVAYGAKHKDGVGDIAAREHDLELMIAAVNAAPVLLAEIDRLHREQINARAALAQKEG